MTYSQMEPESNWLLHLLKGGLVLSLLAALALFVYLFTANLRHGDQQFVIWALVPIAAGMATVCGAVLFMETHKTSWLVWAFVPWVPNILIFLVWGFLVGH